MCKGKIFLALSVGPKGMVNPVQGEPQRGTRGRGGEENGTETVEAKEEPWD